MKRLALIGSKEFAQQIRYFAEKPGEFTIVGYFDDYLESGTLVEGLPVLGKCCEIEKEYQKGSFDQIFLAAGYNNFQFREATFMKLKGKVPFANIIMPRVTIGKNVTFGEGIYVGDDSVIGPNSIIEDNVFIHGNTFLAHDNKVCKHSYLAGRIDTAGFCEIGERNFVGIRALFSDHVKTCPDVWIGIGCMILKSIKESGKYMSNAKLFKIE